MKLKFRSTPRGKLNGFIDNHGAFFMGEVMEEWMDHPGIEPVDEELSGLEEVGEGTICGNCRHYDDGKCNAVAPKDGQEPPAEVEEYAKTIGFKIDGAYFIDYYGSIGWVRGKSRLPIVSWKLCVNTWKRNEDKRSANDGQPPILE